MSILEVVPPSAPPLDPSFRPAALGTRAFLNEVRASGKAVPLAIGLERNPGSRSVFRTEVFGDRAHDEDNFRYIERTVKFLLWKEGGHRIIIGGPSEIGNYIKAAYQPGGSRAFDAEFMAGVYEKPFVVELMDAQFVPPAKMVSADVGRHLDGCRIGFDAGASDRKVAAVVDGKAVYSEEVIWDPKGQKDPQYHYDQIMASMKAAAEKMPRVDAIGVSSAGIYINNRVMVASLFRGIPKDLFERRVKGLFLEIRKAWNNVPLEVVNDGEVTALAGAMNLNDGAVLGIAMGSSEAAGYVTPDGKLTDWLDELAFAPVDFNPRAPADEWSGDVGCGVQYFSQVGAIRLATAAKLAVTGNTPAEKLKSIQESLAKGDPKARGVFESVGCYLGYSLAHYADFYKVKHALILGRVTSGEGGNIVRSKAEAILKNEFPELAGKLKLHLPEEEAERRVGQAIAAASLPQIKQ